MAKLKKEKIFHKTIQVQETYNVDEDILPVVEWLNSINGVKTDFCCHGDEDIKFDPYISFVCDSMLSFNFIIFKFQGFIENGLVKIDVSEPNFVVPRVRFVIRFLNKDVLNDFVIKTFNHGFDDKE